MRQEVTHPGETFDHDDPFAGLPVEFFEAEEIPETIIVTIPEETPCPAV